MPKLDGVTRLRKILCAASVASVVASTVTAQDRCSDILRDGIKNVFQLDASRSETEDTHHWFCSDDFTKFIQNQDASVKITISIDGVPLELSGKRTSGSDWERREKYCSSGQREFTLDQTYSLLRTVADRNIVDGWLRCMVPAADSSALDRPVYVSLSAKGNAVTVTGRWIKQDSRQRNPVVHAVTTTGLSCSNPTLKNGVKLKESATPYTCSWNTDNDAIVVLDTDLGSAAARIPRPLDGKLAGKALLSVVPLAPQWVSIGQRSAVTQTGNHHQSGYGSAGPRRFPYSVRLQVGQNQKLSAVSVHQGGQGCPWTGPRGPLRFEDQARRVVQDFEAWGAPCAWTLVASVSELRDQPQPPQQVGIDLMYGRRFSLHLPAKRESALIVVSMQDGSKFSIAADGPGNQVITLDSREPSGDGENVTFLVQIPRVK